jgi:uncharacterized protein involved in type VI secretion and phage assembly
VSRRRGGLGIVVGVVRDLDDPDSLGRVRVEYPHLENELSEWAPSATLMAGGGRGTFFRPEPEDRVLIGFEYGEPRRPYILGSLWDQTDQPPAYDDEATENNVRFIRSRSGHMIVLDDTDSAERIEIVDKDGTRRVVVDSSGEKIQIVCDSGDVEISASETVSIHADADVAVSAEGDIRIDAGGDLNLSGTNVNIN